MIVLMIIYIFLMCYAPTLVCIVRSPDKFFRVFTLNTILTIAAIYTGVAGESFGIETVLLFSSYLMLIVRSNE